MLESNGTARATTSMSAYPALQASRPTIVQPTTRGESMLYPDFSFTQDYAGQLQQNPPTGSHVTNPQSCGPPPYGILRAPTFSGAAYQDSFSQGAVGTESGGQTQSLGIVLTNQRPPQAKRGPFKTDDERQATAETRKIGSCIRCRMQRIRCQINPENKLGPCLTCQKVSNAKIWRLPCLRYKITDVRLFKPGQVKGHEWTRRWREGVPDDIAHWASLETRMVMVTEGYTNRPVELQVRQFVPQEGDALARSWVHEGKKKSVDIPPYAIVNLEEAKTAYDEYIKRGIWECCQALLSHKEKILLGTYLAAMKHAADPRTPQKEKELLKKALQLWMAIRLTTKSTVIVGEETLGMPRDIMDETSPLRGQIPLPPVMGAQIELVLIHQIQAGLRREMLENLQTMTQANKQQTWFTTYLVTFILLHNVSLLCQHDAGYARKHGFKSRFAREDMVAEYQLGANILLAYFHYCNKGIYPFSPECREQDLSTLAELDKRKIKFVLVTRKAVEEHKKHWAKIRQSGDCENDFYYISQLYEQNWQPQASV
ncbi:hypothetical protein DL765_001308 [Monosporascus sp. GIB2]|nr:hypothetical protein DL765_001308 [Monosporascus sp. GIB2]